MMERDYFLIALKEAKKAYKKGEIPVGAVIVKDNKIIAKSHNNRQKNHNPLGHAEINCIIKSAKHNHDWRLNNGYALYVTLKPCKMCTSIINECRVNQVYYLIDQGNCESGNNFTQTNVCKDIQIEYSNLLKSFFEKLRK